MHACGLGEPKKRNQIGDVSKEEMFGMSDHFICIVCIFRTYHPMYIFLLNFPHSHKPIWNFIYGLAFCQSPSRSTRAQEFVITRRPIGHTKATKSHILSRWPATCHHCGQTLTIDHMLLECAALQEMLDKYYTAESLEQLFYKIPETCIVGFLREAIFFYLIWIVKDYELEVTILV